MDKSTARFLIQNAVASDADLGRCSTPAAAGRLMDGILEAMQAKDGRFQYKDAWYEIVLSESGTQIVLRLRIIRDMPISQQEHKAKPEKPAQVRPIIAHHTKRTLEELKEWQRQGVLKRQAEGNNQPAQPIQKPAPVDDDEPVNIKLEDLD